MTPTTLLDMPTPLSDEAPAMTPPRPLRKPLGRAAVLAFAGLSYLAFLAAFLYAAGFVTGLLVPKCVNGGVPGDPPADGLVDAGLLLLFAGQHIVMARAGFKSWWSRWAPAGTERSAFVLAASAALGLLFWQWRPIEGVLWSVGEPWLRTLLHGLSLTGFLLVVVASFQIDHFHLFGVKQAIRAVRGVAPLAPVFRVAGLYRFVRHPLMTAFLIAFWSAPDMSYGRLLFAGLASVYILVGIRIEERDLIREHGIHYLRYRREVPALLPRLVPRAS
jgi:protein-S-isoprenylcysteine O-methyltransferase Ste14